MKHWKESFKKIFLWKPNTVWIGAAALLGLVLILIPLFRIVPYAIPWYDDYNYGTFTRNFLAEEYSLASAWKGALYCIKTQWYAWQGTFSSIFFMSWMPAVWGERYYVLGPIFLISILTIAVFTFVGVLLKDVLKADNVSCIILQAGITAVVMLLIYHSKFGFYWYNAGVHYVGMHSICILCLAGAVHLLYTKRKITIVLLEMLVILGAFIGGGSNYITALQGFLVILSLLVLGALLRRKRACLLVVPAVVYGAAFYLNASAPGNAVRAAQLSYLSMDAMPAVWQSFVEAFHYLGIFMGWITVAALVMLAPTIWNMVQKLQFSFRYPGLVLLWSFCLYATGFTPSLYSMGNPGLARTLNAVKITYQLLLFINEVYWLGWICRKRRQTGKKVPEGRCVWWFYPVMCGVMLLIFQAEPNKAGNYSSYAAYYYVHTGEAYCFHQEYLERIQAIQSGGPDVVVEPYHFQPWILYAGDLSEDAAAEENEAMSVWYDKESIVVQKMN